MLTTMMHSFSLMAVVSVVWAIVGYSLAFGDGNAFIGDLRYLFLSGVGGAPNADYAATIPQQTFMIYQLMFAVITPALISGAFAERMKFSAMLLFTVLWLLIVYLPLAHMVWGKGGFLNAFSGGKIPCFDFAGGTVVHISSGVSALVCALYLGKRRGYMSEPMKPHSLVISVIGASLLWVGWFGFNAGSALGGIGARHQRIRRHSFRHRRSGARLDVRRVDQERQAQHARRDFGRGGRSGGGHAGVRLREAVPRHADWIGSGHLCFFMVTTVKSKFGYDDTLDAFGVHGAGGTIGALLTGVFATNLVNDGLKDSAGKVLPLGMVDGNGGQIFNQAIGVLISWVLAIVGTLIILKICDALLGVRVSPEQELEGLDVSMHGEEGYNLDS